MRACSNPACTMNGQKVDTTRASCMACGRPLENPLGGLFGNLLGDLGKITGTEPTLDPEVLATIRECETVLSRFNEGSPVTRSQIRSALAACGNVLRRFG